VLAEVFLHEHLPLRPHGAAADVDVGHVERVLLGEDLEEDVDELLVLLRQRLEVAAVDEEPGGPVRAPLRVRE
jgi:hypothetical protein